MSITKDEVSRERARYLAGEITHDAYYLWLADGCGIGASMLPVTLARLQASRDPHFNDIPLATWDNMHYAIRTGTGARSLPWSLSDSVCCLKAIARREVDKCKPQ